MKKALAWTCSLALIGVVTGTAFARPLPAGYTRVEYICGDGATCCFDTDFRPNPSTDRIEVRLTLTDLVATAEFEVAGPNGLVFYLK